MSEINFIDLQYFQKKINEIQLNPLLIVKKEVNLGEALKLMAQHKVGVIAISKEGSDSRIENIEGIITERDFLNKSPINQKNWEQLLVTDLMTKNPSFLDGNLALEHAVKLMIFKKYKQIFIKSLDGEIKVLGAREVLLDIAKVFKKDLDSIGILKNPAFGIEGIIADIVDEKPWEGLEIYNKMVLHAGVLHYPVKKLINQVALIFDENDSTLSVLSKLRQENLAAAVMVRHGTLISGIVTERDFLFKVYGKVLDLDNTPIKNIMTNNPHFLFDRNKLGYALNNILTFNYRNILVLDEEKYPLSIVTLLDILDYLCRKVFDHGVMISI